MSTDHITVTSPAEITYSGAYALMIKGDLDAAVSCLETNGTPEMKNFIKAIDSALQENKEDAQEVKDRGFWKRLFSSNTKDLGNVIFEQNTVLSALYVLLRVQSFSGESCSKMLAELYSYADKEANTSRVENNNIQKAIIATLEKNANEFHLNELRDKALMKLLKAAENSSCFESDIRIKLGEAQKAFEDSESRINKDLQDFIKTANDHINSTAGACTKSIQDIKIYAEESIKSINEQAAAQVQECKSAVADMMNEFEKQRIDIENIIDERFTKMNNDLIEKEKRTKVLAITSLCIAAVSVIASILLVL